MKDVGGSAERGGGCRSPMSLRDCSDSINQAVEIGPEIRVCSELKIQAFSFSPLPSSPLGLSISFKGNFYSCSQDPLACLSSGEFQQVF